MLSRIVVGIDLRDMNRPLREALATAALEVLVDSSPLSAYELWARIETRNEWLAHTSSVGIADFVRVLDALVEQGRLARLPGPSGRRMYAPTVGELLGTVEGNVVEGGDDERAEAEELVFSVASRAGAVRLDFGRRVRWIEVPPDVARGYARLLYRHADAAERADNTGEEEL